MGHVPSLYVLCSPLLFKVVLWPNFGHCTTTINVWERIGANTWHSLCEKGRVNPIILPNTGWDVS